METRGLRIAFIGARGVAATYSGIETYYEEVGARLAERGHEVTAYCRTRFTPDLSSYRGVKIRRLPALPGKHIETFSHSLLSTLDSLFRRFDVVQYHAIGSAPFAIVPRLFGTPTVVSVRGLDWQRAKWGRVARAYLKSGEWASARLPCETTVVSQALQNHYARVYGRETCLIPNPVACWEPRPARIIREEYGLEKDGFLLFAGRLSPEKGVATLLEALRPLPRTKKLVLAGGSSYSDAHMRELREAAWHDVIFLGQVSHEVMRELYSNCYAFVLPSHMEGLSIALLEALGHGCCIICTNIPENLEVIGPGGLDFPPGDAVALRGLLARVLESPGVVQDYRERALRRASAHPDWDHVAKETEELYFRLVRRSGWPIGGGWRAARERLTRSRRSGAESE